MKIIIAFLLITVIIALVMIGVATSRKETRDLDSQYIDENGDHVYYDRSLIKKKHFLRLHPGDKGLRTLRRLFYRDRH